VTTRARRDELVPGLADVFRRHGYEGATLALIGEATGLGKGSLYNLFPGGKAEMAALVLAHVDGWFAREIFAPLREAPQPDEAIRAMLRATDRYFHSGGRLCVVGVVALGASRDEFAAAVHGYFAAWIDALAAALRRRGETTALARRKAEQAVLAIQGALVLTRALDDTAVFRRALQEAERQLLEA
jgi:AcrR family transcriptional regulator